MTPVLAFKNLAHHSSFLIWVAMYLVFLAASIILSRWLKRRLKERRSPFISEHEFNKEYKENHNGIEYRFEMTSGEGGSFLRVSIECASQGEFRIVKEVARDYFLKNIGIAMELQTGDAEFDKAFFIQTDSDEFARDFFKSAEKRKAIKAIFDKGMTSIQHNGKLFRVEVALEKVEKTLNKGFITSLVEPLHVLTQGLPSHFTPQKIFGMRKGKVKRVGAWIFLASFLAFGLYYFMTDAWNHPYPLTGGDGALSGFFKPALLLCVFFAVVAVAAFKDTSYSTDFLYFILMSPLTFMAGIYFCQIINGALDFSPASRHAVKVINKFVSGGSDEKPSYYVYVPSLEHPGRTSNLVISENEFWKILPGETMLEVATKPGRLGVEWVASAKVQDETAMIGHGKFRIESPAQIVYSVRICKQKGKDWDCKQDYSSSDEIYFYIYFKKQGDYLIEMRFKNLDSDEDPLVSHQNTNRNWKYCYFYWEHLKKGRWIAEVYNGRTFLGQSYFAVH